MHRWLDASKAAPLEEIRASFLENGYARVGQVLNEEGQAALRARAREIMLGEVRYEGMFFQLDTTSGSYDDLVFGKGYEGPSENYRKIEKMERDPLYREWLENPLFETIARSFIEDEIVLYRAVLFSKKNQGGTYLPWHQDGGKFWGLSRDPYLQIWTAIDDVPTESGCVEVFPKSHTKLVTPLGGVVPKNFLEAHVPEKHAVALPARAGEVLLIHNLLWHRSHANQTNEMRRAFTVCYMSEKTECLRTKRTKRVFVPVFRH